MRLARALPAVQNPARLDLNLKAHWNFLKFFRINHRDEQVSEQRDGDEADNEVFHK
jgi:hypothetical protein